MRPNQRHTFSVGRAVTDNNYYAFARHALVAGLRHLDVRPGEQIGVPELICRDVLSSIQAVGALPVFYPVDTSLRPTSRGPAEMARVILAVNYFGFPQSLSDFTNLWPNSSIIEDNAHGYLSRDINGEILGSRTEVGITSFRKTLRVPDGAILTTSSPINTSLMTQVVDRPPSFAFKVRLLAGRLERSANFPVQQILRSATRSIRKIRTGSDLPMSNQQSESELPKPREVSAWSLKRLNSLDKPLEIQRRRTLFLDFLSASEVIGIRPVFPSLPEFCSPYGFPFFADKVPPAFLRLVRKRHCEVISWPDLPSAMNPPEDHFYRTLKVVNFL